MNNKYRGVFAVICTPFQEDEKVDEMVLRHHIRWLIDDCNVHAIIPCGSTGEFAFLTEEERKFVVKTTIEEVNGQIPVIAGSAACSTNDTMMYAQTYQKMGVDGVMVVPSYYGTLKQEELYCHFSTLAKNIDIPIILYNNPGTSGSDILPPLVARLAKFDNIVAIKESTGLMQRVVDIKLLCGDSIEVLCGCDTLVMECSLWVLRGGLQLHLMWRLNNVLNCIRSWLRIKIQIRLGSFIKNYAYFSIYLKIVAHMFN